MVEQVDEGEGDSEHSVDLDKFDANDEDPAAARVHQSIRNEKAWLENFISRKGPVLLDIVIFVF